MDLVIEGPPADLEWLRRQIEQELGAAAQLEAVPARDAGELREPLVIALIVSLGGAELVKGLVKVLRRRYEHREEIARINGELRIQEMDHELEMTKLRLQVTDESGTRPLTEDELADLAS